MQTTIGDYFVVKNSISPKSQVFTDKELVKKISEYLSPFVYLTLSQVSKQFEANLNNDSFWSEEFIKMIQPVTGYGLSIRSQFIARAIDEYQLLKGFEREHEAGAEAMLNDELDDNKIVKLRLINTVEMARRAGLICSLFLKHVDKDLMGDKFFILGLIDVPNILNFASEKIKKNSKIRKLAKLNKKPLNPEFIKFKGDTDNILFIRSDKLLPEQRALFISQITESIKNDPDL